MTWGLFFIFLIVSAACCSIGFKKTVYFLSTGYGISIAGLGIAYLVTILLKGYAFGPVMILQCLIFAAYGLRLAGFLIYRENKSGAYRKVLNAQKGSGSDEPFFVKLAIWICVAALYILQTCPVFFRAFNGKGTETVLPLIGLLISLVGLVLETEADLQKHKLKKISPDKPAMSGVYRFVRCPNYFGEMVFWTGVLIGGLNAISGILQWVMAIAGYVTILMIMVGGAKRLEKRQEARYGKDPEYRTYAEHTPILLPLIPIYSLGGRKNGEQ
jgi:steroid 5-alpha reductase family enzyme